MSVQPLSDPLQGCWAKLARAIGHLKSFQAEMRAFFDGNPYTLIKETQTDAGKYTFRLNIVREVPKEPWSLIIGDCIHNARTALDHIFWALILRNHPEGIQASTAHFPILNDRGTFLGRKADFEKWIGAEATAIIEGLQPFQGGNPVNDLYSDTLSILHNFDIADKHKLLLPVAAISKEDAIHVTGPPTGSYAGQIFKEAILGSVENNTIIAIVHLVPPHPGVNVNLHADFDVVVQIAFRIGDSSREYSVVPCLKKLTSRVYSVACMFAPILGVQVPSPKDLWSS